MAQTASNEGGVITINSGTYFTGFSFLNNSGILNNFGTIESISSLSNTGTLSGNGTYIIGGTFTNTGAFTVGTSTVEFNGSSAQTIPALNYYHITSSSTGARTLASSGTIGVAGTFTKGTNTYTTTGSTVDFNGAAQTVPVLSFNNLILSGTSTKTLTGLSTVNGNFTMSGGNTTNAATTVTLSVGGNMTVNSGNTLTLINGNPSLNVTGNTSISGTVTSPGAAKTFGGSFTINSGGSWTEQASPVYNFAGNFINNGTFNAGTSNANFNGTSTISGSSTTTFHDITVASSKSLTSASGTVGVSGSFTNNGTFNHNNGTILLSGTGAAHTIGGSSSITFNNLTLNGQTANKVQTLTRNVSVIGTLTLTKGTLVSSASSLLTIENGGSITGYSDDGLIEGTLKRVGTGSSPYAVVFPLKGNTYLQAVTITYGSASSQDAFTVSYVGNAHANRGNKKANIENVSDKEYWDITPTWGSGSSNETNGVKVDIVYRSPSGKYFTNKNKDTYRIGHFDGTNWEIPSTGYAISHTTTDDGVSGTLSQQGVKNFSPFTPVAGLDAAALPVKLASFTAKKTIDNKVSLNWLTTSESMNKGFRIERQSANLGSKFEQIGYVPTKAPMGNSQSRLSYSFMDKNVRAGETIMYRLLQEDLDGTLTTSEVRMIRVDGHSVVFLYPNPSPGNVVISRTDSGKKMNIHVYDQSGRVVQHAENIIGPTYSFTLGVSGTYMIKLTHPETGEQSIQRIVIQK